MTTRRFEVGSGSGSGVGSEGRLVALDDTIMKLLQEEVVAYFQAQLTEMFRSIKTTIIEYFDECYVALSEIAAVAATTTVAAAGVGSGRVYSIGNSTI